MYSIEEALHVLQEELAVLLSSEDACEEYLQAKGHVDNALRRLRERDERLAQEQERARIESEAQSDGTYDTFEDGPRDVGSTDS